LEEKRVSSFDLVPSEAKPAAYPDPDLAPLRVFVMGCSRGGTTVTQRLVAERLGLYTLPETRFFANMIGNVEARMFPDTARGVSLPRRISSGLREALGRSTGMPLLNLPGVAPIQGQKWASFSRMTALFVAQMDGLAGQAGTTGWLEKTPFHVLYAPHIARLVPGAWMIHILRDAQETVGSIRDAANRFADPWASVYDRVERDVDNWNASVAASAAMLGQPRQIFVPYDVMTRHPGQVMDHIAQIMGQRENQVPENMDQAKMAPANMDQADLGPTPIGGAPALTSRRDQHWKQAAVSGAVRPAQSKWQDALTASERARAQALIRPVPETLLAAMAPFLQMDLAS
jgi:hypothetical protein